MRKRLQTYRHRFIRFRQWSRKGYAIFASLGVCTTIGQLRKNVTERALRKQAAPSATLGTENLPQEQEARETDTTPPTPTELLTQLFPPVTLQQTTAARAGQPYNTGKHITPEVTDTSSIRLGGTESCLYTLLTAMPCACRAGKLLRPNHFNNPHLL